MALHTGHSAKTEKIIKDVGGTDKKIPTDNTEARGEKWGGKKVQSDLLVLHSKINNKYVRGVLIFDVVCFIILLILPDRKGPAPRLHISRAMTLLSKRRGKV